MANFFKTAGEFLGALQGGKLEVTAQAGTLKLNQEIQKTRGIINQKAQKLGAKLAPTIGGDFFKALSEGSDRAASEARAKEAGRLTGFAIDPRKLPIYALGAGLGIYLLWRYAHE